MLSHWAKYSNNFGDILTPFIVQRMGYKIEWIGRGGHAKLLAVGSIIDRAKPNDVIWGSGLMRPVPIEIPEGVKVLAVRGPMARGMMRNAEVPEVYGDPGILLPRFYTPQIPTQQWSIGLIPHEAEKRFIKDPNDPEIRLIDVNAGVAEVVDAIASCDVILSSSLHGLIAADAYGIPCAWVKISHRVHGGRFKFDDYCLGARQDLWPLLKWESPWDPKEIAGFADQARVPKKIDGSHLVKAFRDHYDSL